MTAGDGRARSLPSGRWAALALVVVLVGVIGTAAAVRSGPRSAAAVTQVTGTALRPDRADGVVFEDDFGGPAVSTDRWGTCHWWGAGGCTIASNQEQQWYLPSQVTQSGGVLRLTAEASTTTAPDGRVFPYRSGMVSTGPSDGGTTPERFAFRYGTLEARVRVPAGGGLWPAVWMLPVSLESRPEIDLLEVKGSEPEVITMHAHLRAADGRWRWQGASWQGPDLSEGWHDIALEWQSGHLRWLVDGTERFAVRGSAVPDEPMYIVANLAVGGTWSGPVDDATVLPASFEIDSIRVRELP